MRRAIQIAVFLFFLFALFEGTSRLLTPPYKRAVGDFVASDYLFLGSSHTRAGVDAELISRELGEPVARIGVPGATTRDKGALLKYYISEYGAPKYLFYEIGVLMFDARRFVGSSFQQLYPLSDNDEIAGYLRDRDEWSNYYVRRFVKPLRFNGVPWVYAIRTLTGTGAFAHRRSIEGQTDVWEKRVKEQFPDRQLELGGESISLLESTLETAGRHGIKVYLVYLPESYLLTRYFDYSQIDEALLRLRTEYDAGLVNFNETFEYDNGMFADVDHLNRDGRKRFSLMMADTIRRIGKLSRPLRPTEQRSEGSSGSD